MELSKEIESLISKDYKNTTGLIGSCNGKIIFDKSYGENPNARYHVFSVTKSIVVIILGIAIDKGFIQSVTQKVLDFFPEYKVKKENDTIKDVTIEDILTMTAPYKYCNFPNYTKYFTSDDWVKSSLDMLGGKKKSGKFFYAGLIGPDIITGIITRATGMSVLDFAKKYLFTPMGISVNDNIVFKNKEEQFAFYKNVNNDGWVSDRQGVNTAGWGLNLTTSEMLKIGELFLNNGKYGEKQIVSSEWLKNISSEHSYCKKFKLSYGYFWWLLGSESFAAMGDGGNFIYINRNDKIVIASTALMVPRAKLRIDLIKNYLEPLCKGK